MQLLMMEVAYMMTVQEHVVVQQLKIVLVLVMELHRLMNVEFVQVMVLLVLRQQTYFSQNMLKVQVTTSILKYIMPLQKM